MHSITDHIAAITGLAARPGGVQKTIQEAMVARELLSATWITLASHVVWVKLSGLQALPTLQLWLIFLSYAHWVLTEGLLFLYS